MLENEDAFQRKLFTLEHTALTVLAQSSTGEQRCMNMCFVFVYKQFPYSIMRTHHKCCTIVSLSYQAFPTLEFV
jgi:hypothetical protein